VVFLGGREVLTAGVSGLEKEPICRVRNREGKGKKKVRVF